MTKTDEAEAYFKLHPDASVRQVAAMLGCSRKVVRNGKRKVLAGLPFEVADAPADDIDVPTLLAHKQRIFTILKERHDYDKLVPINVKIDGPIGIVHFGDPHLDADGCDIAQLMHDVDICKNTPGMFAGSVGDMSDNWVGRLAHLWNGNSITEKQSWALVEWFVTSVRWLYLVSGNHDQWSGDKDPIRWMIGQAGNRGPSSVRFELNFPNGRKVRVNARHDFSGHSMWNPAHGAMKAAKMGWQDHILTCGHTHVSGYGFSVDPATGLISHCVQVATYKTIDNFSKQKCFPDHNISPCCVTIINPDAKKERQLVQVMWDIDVAAEYLTWLRGR